MLSAGQMLKDMSQAYGKKIAEDMPGTVVEFCILPDGDVWHLVIGPGREIDLGQGSQPGTLFSVLLTRDTLTQIYNGEMTALTAAGRENLSDPAPLDFRLGQDVSLTPEIYQQIILFIQRFFWATGIECIRFGEKHARFVHGGWAVPLFYDKGFRTAWYLIKCGERLNNPTDHNPFPQGFVILSGEGEAEIGGHRLSVASGQAYYIPPGANHMVWTERDEPMTLLWMAWGAGA